jgi:hypothetical protein
VDVDHDGVVAATTDRVGEELNLLDDGVPRLDDACGVSIGSTATVATPMLDDVVLRLVKQDQDACCCKRWVYFYIVTIIVSCCLPDRAKAMEGSCFEPRFRRFNSLVSNRRLANDPGRVSV